MDLSLATRTVTPEILKGLTDAELVALADGVGLETGEEFVTKGEREDAIERGMATDLTDDYLEDLLEASGQELEKLPEENVETEQVGMMLRGIGTEMDARDTTLTSAVLGAGVTALALLSRGAAAARFALMDPPPATITGSFSQAEVNALSAISRQQLWWIGDLWSQNLSQRIAATVAREGIATGLGRVQVGQILRGVVLNGTGARVPGTWNGSTESYFTMLAGTVRNRASNFGAISAMDDAQFTHYRISAVLDERTSEVCREMHDRTFRVKDAKRHIERAEAAEDPDQYKSIAGWMTTEQVRQIAGEGSPERQSANLADAGLALPPYHGKCRTIVIEEGPA